MGSRKRKKKHNGELVGQTPRRRNGVPIWAILVGIVLVGGIVLLLLPSGEETVAKSIAQASPPATTSATSAKTPVHSVSLAGEAKSAPPAHTATTADSTKTASAAKSGYDILTGRWRRPDGGYVVDVQSVDENGKMDASYFNPKPINVSKAEASQEGAATKVFIELRDANYPGSTYNLIYVPERDQLQGIYYQAALQERFEVVFVRIK